MKIPKTFYVILFILSLISCQSKKVSCKTVTNGQFHVYPSREQHYLIIRNDTTQSEVNLATGDTSYWKVKWLSDCDFVVQYVSGGRIESKEQEEFYKKVVAQFRIQKVTSQYYVSNGIYRTPKGDRTSTDTTWLKEK